MSEFKAANTTEEIIQKQLINWVLLVGGVVILSMITLMNIYYNIGSSTINLILLSVQFVTLITSIKYYLKTKKLKKSSTIIQGTTSDVSRTKGNILKRLKSW